VSPNTAACCEGLSARECKAKASGRGIGRFLPENAYLELLEELEWLKPVSEQERQDALAEMVAGKCSTTEQLLAELDEIEKSWETASIITPHRSP
jgi:hypothetical protein